jgi:hypothetical protein
VEKSLPVNSSRQNSDAELTAIGTIRKNMRKSIPCSEEVIPALKDKFPKVIIKERAVPT